eukprot:g6468.t1
MLLELRSNQVLPTSTSNLLSGAYNSVTNHVLFFHTSSTLRLYAINDFGLQLLKRLALPAGDEVSPGCMHCVPNYSIYVCFTNHRNRGGSSVVLYNNSIDRTPVYTTECYPAESNNPAASGFVESTAFHRARSEFVTVCNNASGAIIRVWSLRTVPIGTGSKQRMEKRCPLRLSIKVRRTQVRQILFDESCDRIIGIVESGLVVWCLLTGKVKATMPRLQRSNIDLGSGGDVVGSSRSKSPQFGDTPSIGAAAYSSAAGIMATYIQGENRIDVWQNGATEVSRFKAHDAPIEFISLDYDGNSVTLYSVDGNGCIVLSDVTINGVQQLGKIQLESNEEKEMNKIRGLLLHRSDGGRKLLIYRGNHMWLLEVHYSTCSSFIHASLGSLRHAHFIEKDTLSKEMKKWVWKTNSSILFLLSDVGMVDVLSIKRHENNRALHKYRIPTSQRSLQMLEDIQKPNDNDAAQCIYFAVETNAILIGRQEGHVDVLKPQTGERIRILKCNEKVKGAICSLSSLPWQNNCVIIGGASCGSLVVWDLQNAANKNDHFINAHSASIDVIIQWKTPALPVHRAVFVSCAADGSVKVWEMKRNSSIVSAISTAAASAHRLARSKGQRDGGRTSPIFEKTSIALRGCFHVETGTFGQLSSASQVTPQLIVVGLTSGKIELWHLPFSWAAAADADHHRRSESTVATTRSPLFVISAHSLAVESLTASKDGKWVISTSLDHTSILWKVYEGHSDIISMADEIIGRKKRPQYLVKLLHMHTFCLSEPVSRAFFTAQKDISTPLRGKMRPFRGDSSAVQNDIVMVCGNRTILTPWPSLSSADNGVEKQNNLRCAKVTSWDEKITPYRKVVQDEGGQSKKSLLGGIMRSKTKDDTSPGMLWSINSLTRTSSYDGYNHNDEEKKSSVIIDQNVSAVDDEDLIGWSKDTMNTNNDGTVLGIGDVQTLARPPTSNSRSQSGSPTSYPRSPSVSPTNRHSPKRQKDLLRAAISLTTGSYPKGGDPSMQKNVSSSIRRPMSQHSIINNPGLEEFGTEALERLEEEEIRYAEFIKRRDKERAIRSQYGGEFNIPAEDVLPPVIQEEEIKGDIACFSARYSNHPNDQKEKVTIVNHNFGPNEYITSGTKNNGSPNEETKKSTMKHLEDVVLASSQVNVEKAISSSDSPIINDTRKRSDTSEFSKDEAKKAENGRSTLSSTNLGLFTIIKEQQAEQQVAAAMDIALNSEIEEEKKEDNSDTVFVSTKALGSTYGVGTHTEAQFESISKYENSVNQRREHLSRKLSELPFHSLTPRAQKLRMKSVLEPQCEISKSVSLIAPSSRLQRPVTSIDMLSASSVGHLRRATSSYVRSPAREFSKSRAIQNNFYGISITMPLHRGEQEYSDAALRLEEEKREYMELVKKRKKEKRFMKALKLPQVAKDEIDGVIVLQMPEPQISARSRLTLKVNIGHLPPPVEPPFAMKWTPEPPMCEEEQLINGGPIIPRPSRPSSLSSIEKIKPANWETMSRVERHREMVTAAFDEDTKALAKKVGVQTLINEDFDEIGLGVKDLERPEGYVDPEGSSASERWKSFRLWYEKNATKCREIFMKSEIESISSNVLILQEYWESLDSTEKERMKNEAVDEPHLRDAVRKNGKVDDDFLWKWLQMEENVEDFRNPFLSGVVVDTRKKRKSRDVADVALRALFKKKTSVVKRNDLNSRDKKDEKEIIKEEPKSDSNAMNQDALMFIFRIVTVFAGKENGMIKISDLPAILWCMASDYSVPTKADEIRNIRRELQSSATDEGLVESEVVARFLASYSREGMNAEGQIVSDDDDAPNRFMQFMKVINLLSSKVAFTKLSERERMTKINKEKIATVEETGEEENSAKLKESEESKGKEKSEGCVKDEK